MQHRYVGDVGDFGKYGLLRILCGLNGQKPLRLGVVWYLFPDESHNDDGKHLSYLLEKPSSYKQFKICDELLHSGLKQHLSDAFGNVVMEKRHLNTIEMSGLLPKETCFYSEPLSFQPNESYPARIRKRAAWIDGALKAVADAEVVFLDPDNGIECKSVSMTASKGPKYTYWDDIEAFVKREQSLVIYHHMNHSAKHVLQVKAILEEIEARFKRKAEALIFNRGTSRAYFVIPAPGHCELIRERLASVTAGPWNQHFVSPTDMPGIAQT